MPGCHGQCCHLGGAVIRIKNTISTTVACLFMHMVFAQHAHTTEQPAISQADLDELVGEHSLFSGSVIVAQEGEPVAQVHHGFADRNSGRKNSSQTLYSIASVGKMFTAVAIVQLVEANKLRYETPVVDIIPELAERISGSITVDHLLRHTSGIGRISGVDDATLNSLASNTDYFALVVSKGIGSDGPGDFSYRNENYQVLGEIIARVSGQTYETYVRERIAKPTGMMGPVFDPGERGDDIAHHYMAVDFETWWNSEESIVAKNADEFIHRAPQSTPSAGGGAYVTAMDMIKFAAALRSGVLVSPESLRHMCPADFNRPTDKRRYGRGCTVESGPRYVRTGHTGSTAGIQARFYLYPERGIDVIVLSNHDEQAAPVFREIDRLIQAH